MEISHKQFNTFDKVLVRGINKWQIDFYSYWDEEEKSHNTLSFGGSLIIEDKDILPYEGNEHLVGTDDSEQEIKLEEGEYIVCFDDMVYYDSVCSFALSKFTFINNGWFYTNDNNAWRYAIRTSDFNPKDMEETRKHILRVRKGKITRYKC